MSDDGHRVLGAAELPAEVDIIIIGGGIAGCSLAYHLAAFGAGTVLLLEQSQLAAGTTWHAAGAVGRLRVSPNLARLNDRSAKMYARMQDETGRPTGWIENGSLSVARTSERMTSLRRAGAMAAHFGVDVVEVGVGEIKAQWPLVKVDDLIGGVWLPNDGIVHPAQLVDAIAEGARRLGAVIRTGIRVGELDCDNGRVRGVVTEHGRVAAERTVLCGGMWTPQLARSAGVKVPLQPVEHHYVLSHPVDPSINELPVVRDPDGSIYFRGREERILLGAFQAKSKPWLVDRVPDDFSFQLLDPDWEHFAPPLREGLKRLPSLDSLGIAEFVNGPESFTPDGNPLIGELPGVRGLLVCAGFNSSGLAYAGGVGEALAEWIVHGEQPFDLSALDVRRFSSRLASTSFLRARGVEVLGRHMRMPYPNLEWEQGRDLERSPLYQRLAARNACYGEKFGVERPNWFSRNGQPPRMSYTFGRPDWFESSRDEHLTTRERAGLFDQSSFAKFTVRGPDAVSLLQRACANDVDVNLGRVVYTAMLSSRGTFASDLTVVRLEPDAFLVVTGTAQRVSDLEWLRAQMRRGECVELIDVTEEWAVLGLMGPNARQILSELCDVELSDDAFPFSTAQALRVAGVPCRALRITYVGELGWEIQVPSERSGEVYDAIRGSAGPAALADAGYYAINSLRLEKGYRQWGADITLNDTPLEAGLSFAVAWEKPIPFQGRDALLRQREAEPPSKRLVSLLLEDPEPMLWGGERFFCDGQCVGYTTSGAYGHSVGAAVALGYLKLDDEPITEDLVARLSLEVDIAGERVPARASLRSLFDPERSRILS